MHPDGRAGRGALGRIGGRRTVIGEPAVASPDRRSDPAGRGGTRRRYVAAERERRVSGSGEHPSTGLSRDTDGAILEKPTASFSCRSRYRRRFRKSPRAICAQPFPMQSAKLRNGLAHTRSRQTWRRFASSPLAYSADTSPALPGCRWLPRSSGDFAEPSDGLEPSTPSLPCAPERLPWVATGCGLACLSGFRGRLICHWLPLVAPAGLHKCSILGARDRRWAKEFRRPACAASSVEPFSVWRGHFVQSQWLVTTMNSSPCAARHG
jgi:hypothetical protein